MDPQIEGLRLFAEGILKLFHPLLEVVVHQLNKDKIAYIAGSHSPRKLGDPSYLSKADRSLPPGVYGPYSKISAEGKAMKSISMVFPSASSERYMMCINFDVSDFQHIQSLMTTLTTLSFFEPEKPLKPLEVYFDANWQDKIHQFVNENLIAKGRSLNQLSRIEKKELVFALRDQGAFNGKNAAAYIAQILKVSRASIYGYLKEEP